MADKFHLKLNNALDYIERDSNGIIGNYDNLC